jgi:putative MATE family efflux protein
MQVDKSIQKMAAQYFFILYLPMLFRTATSIFGMVLRSAGDTKTPMLISIYVNVINIILNFLLIYPTREIFGIPVIGAGLGVMGAAIASAISFVFGGIAITVCIYKHPDISPRGQKISPDCEILRPCLKVALPNMLQRFGTSLGYVAFAAQINALGEVPTAAHTIANTVESLFYIPGYGMQTAAATLAGNAYGARDSQRTRDLASMFIPIEVILMIITGALLFIFAPPMMGMFSKSQEVIDLGSTVLRMVALSEPFYGFSIIIEGMMLGVGKTKQPFVYNIVGMWGIRIVGTFICTQIFNFGFVAAWACMIAHNLLLFMLFLISYIRGTWNPLAKVYTS